MAFTSKTVPVTEYEHDRTLEEVDELPVSGSRKRWMALVWMLTFYIPDFLVRWLGRMKRKDVRIAWREKLAINILIWFSCLFVVFFIGRYSLPVNSSHLLNHSHLAMDVALTLLPCSRLSPPHLSEAIRLQRRRAVGAGWQGRQ